MDAETTLSDGVVSLRPWRTTDTPAVFAACQDPLIARFTRIPQPYTETDAHAFIVARRADWDSGEERSFAIVDPTSGELLGAMTRFRPHGHRVEFGYWLAPHARGRGVATRALRLITSWTLETTALVRLEIQADVENDASGRVAERAGYVREGIRRAWELDRDGRPRASVFYALVRDAR